MFSSDMFNALWKHDQHVSLSLNKAQKSMFRDIF